MPCVARSTRCDADARETGFSAEVSRSEGQFCEEWLAPPENIEGELGSFGVASDGEIQGPRSVQESADNLDIDAQTATEKLVSSTLQVLLTARLMHNTAVGTISSKIKLAMASTPVYDDQRALRELEIKQLVAKSPTVISMRQKESVCSNQIEDLLRARKFHSIPACSAEELRIDIPADPDVSINDSHLESSGHLQP